MSDSPAAILYDGYGNPISIINGSISITIQSSTGTITSVPVAIVDTILLVSNPARKGVFIYNNASSALLYMGLSSSAVSANIFSVQLDAGGLFEIPFGYTGEIHGIWSAIAPGEYALITELE